MKARILLIYGCFNEFQFQLLVTELMYYKIDLNLSQIPPNSIYWSLSWIRYKLIRQMVFIFYLVTRENPGNGILRIATRDTILIILLSLPILRIFLKLSSLSFQVYF
jgi:hypothetical protein